MMYKSWIKKKIVSYRARGEGRTLGRIAEALRVDPSYLSRFLGDPDIHFSDELIYRLLKQIEATESEIDFLFLLKDWDRTEYPERKEYLQMKIQAHRASEWTPNLENLKKQVSEILRIIEKIDS